jgi:hypothetical protein
MITKFSSAESETEVDEAEEDGGQPESRVVQEMRQQVADLERSRQQADQEKLNKFARLKREAVASGDTEKYDDLVKEEGQFYQNLATRGQQQDAAITAKWMGRNRWMQNAYLQGCAQAIAQRFADTGITGEKQLRLVEKEMRSDPEFARLIANYETGAHARTNKTSPSPIRSGKRDWNSIPAAERKVLEKSFIRDARASNFMPNTDASRARLAKSWWDSNYPEE